MPAKTSKKIQRWNWAAKWRENVLSCLGLIFGTQRFTGSNSSKIWEFWILSRCPIWELEILKASHSRAATPGVKLQGEPRTAQLRWAPSRSSRFPGRNRTTRRGWAWSWQPQGGRQNFQPSQNDDLPSSGLGKACSPQWRPWWTFQRPDSIPAPSSRCAGFMFGSVPQNSWSWLQRRFVRRQLSGTNKKR